MEDKKEKLFKAPEKEKKAPEIKRTPRVEKRVVEKPIKQRTIVYTARAYYNTFSPATPDYYVRAVEKYDNGKYTAEVWRKKISEF